MITVENLQYTYTRATIPAVKNLNFTIEQGEIFGFLGPSGAGKSTTQKLLIRMLTGYEGKASVFGKDLDRWGSDYYERIGVSFELPNHFLKLTAIENLAYFGSLYKRASHSPQELLKMVGLSNDGDLLVSQYSKGMKNRLTVARALTHSPELLFLDEPTAGLDPMNARRIKELIKAQQNAGKTIFLTTHDMTVADALCDRVAFIVDGEIKLIDAPKRLKLQHGSPTVRVEYLHNGDSRPVEQEFALPDLGQNGFVNLIRLHPVQTIHTQEATLEDVFIQITGRSLS
ncbi:MAG: ABC transporter ATP-binding protein [Anaerolineae bacterium]|jgi:fluoroquinolone transport system ATP-binding protein|nr:ABC transporter ATP-binding protein [Anaerolineae bacterium]MBT4311298.1 ABC transporter ATP-binding protein [Anaerolineae bacterium]MBT4457004.1 ABC transporter ATP-binding protein [Anaerolineae bacterium]MBT4841510.1 ABC transporter ATP-binding protein [Anaerolineae bacterium]MBT6061373.1 ABC transporter ATP-binding protein [Anaerolineae bacterium]